MKPIKEFDNLERSELPFLIPQLLLSLALFHLHPLGDKIIVKILVETLQSVKRIKESDNLRDSEKAGH